MFKYQIQGNTYSIKDDLKSIRPSSKNFNNRWFFIKDTKSWELHIQNHFKTKTFIIKLENFCMKHRLKLFVEEYSVENSNIKSINDFDNEASFFDYLHTSNSMSKKFIKR